MSKLNFFIKYSSDDTVIPNSLVRTKGHPRIKGHWHELFSVCCDPNYEPYLSFSRKKAWVQLSPKGEPIAGPIIRVNKPKSGRFIQVPFNICCDPAVVPIEITEQPEDITVTEGDTATFSVTATGSNLTYQWQLNGVDISGATSSSYTTPALTVGDSGNEYTVVITNELGSVTSDPAVVTVEPEEVEE